MAIKKAFETSRQEALPARKHSLISNTGIIYKVAAYDAPVPATLLTDLLDRLRKAPSVFFPLTILVEEPVNSSMPKFALDDDHTMPPDLSPLPVIYGRG
jgi:hypothetical protein